MSSTPEFIQGTEIEIPLSIDDLNALPVAADELKIRIEIVGGTVAEYELGVDSEVTTVSTGRYLFRCSTLTPNRYNWEWHGDGTVPVRSRGSFVIVAQR